MTTKTDINELARQLREASITDRECRERGDGPSDEWSDAASIENILLILNALEVAQDEVEKRKNHAIFVRDSWEENTELKNRIAELEASQPVVSEWRVINSRHPAHHADVLIYCTESDEQMVGYRFSDTEFAYAVDESGTVIVCEPSHWMPTPAAPALQDE